MWSPQFDLQIQQIADGNPGSYVVGAGILGETVAKTFEKEEPGCMIGTPGECAAQQYGNHSKRKKALRQGVGWEDAVSRSSPAHHSSSLFFTPFFFL